MNIKPIDRKSLYEEITTEIIHLIKTGQWKPGDKITGEVALAEAFGVSRNSIREALKALELSGIIVARPGKGTFLAVDAMQHINRMELVSTIKGTQSYDELMETRLIVEPQLAYLASKRASKTDIDELKQLIKEQSEAVENGSYNITLGLKFHNKIMEASRNEVLAKFMNSIADELCAQRFVQISRYFDGHTLAHELQEHQEILDHIAAGEADLAKEKVYTHIKNAKDSLRKIEI